MSEIVKVQAPLNAGNTQYMIYARGKTNMQLVGVSHMPAWVLVSIGDRPKAYFKAEWSGGHGWDIIERVGDQSW